MLVFIHNNFKIDLTYLKVTFSDVNQWFKDDFSTEISLPFDFYLDSELSKSSGFEAHYNSVGRTSLFTGVLDKDGVLVDAQLKFENITGKKVSAIIKAGIENFPSFDKKLSELPLEQKEVLDLKADALNTIGKIYPETNYNFPMIHTDKYNTSEDFHGFEKIINKYVNGAYVENILDTESQVDTIKNILQPLPYKMHVLKAGIEAGGYTLEGDILNDKDLNEGLLFRDGSYFVANSKSEVPIVYNNDQYNFLAYQDNSFQYVTFEKEITVERKGDYLIFGSIFSLVYTARRNPAWSHDRYRCSKLLIKIEKISSGISTTLFNFWMDRQKDGTSNLMLEVREDEIDIPVSFNQGDIIKITKTEPKRDYIPSNTPEYPEAISLSLIPLRYRNPDNTPILQVLPLNEINLTRVVPEITFKDYVTAIKNWGNYGFVPYGKVIRMDLIDPQLDRNAAVDLSDLDIPEPRCTLHDTRKFEVAFSDGKSSDKYKYDSVLVSKDETIINNYPPSDNYSQIKIDALPLPVVTRDNISTALTFEDETAKIRVVYMKRMPTGGSPVSYENTNVQIPKVVQTRFLKWLNFRINSIGWEWEFTISASKFSEITLQTLIYAYQNYHILTELQKERINKTWWLVTAKTESLE